LSLKTSIGKMTRRFQYTAPIKEKYLTKSAEISYNLDAQC